MSTLPLEVRISRLRELANYVGEQPKTSAELARTLTTRLHRHIESHTVDRWFTGDEIPSLEERTALAVSFGFDGEAAAYLVSDNPDVYTPYAQQLENFLEIAKNTTGLIALRASEKPLSDKARSALAQLANPDASIDDGV